MKKTEQNMSGGTHAKYTKEIIKTGFNEKKHWRNT